jgi:hypothetical protein
MTKNSVQPVIVIAQPAASQVKEVLDDERVSQRVSAALWPMFAYPVGAIVASLAIINSTLQILFYVDSSKIELYWYTHIFNVSMLLSSVVTALAGVSLITLCRSLFEIFYLLYQSLIFGERF